MMKIFQSAFTERRAKTLSMPYMAVANTATFGTVTPISKEKDLTKATLLYEDESA